MGNSSALFVRLPLRGGHRLLAGGTLLVLLLVIAASVIGIVQPESVYREQSLKESFLPNDVANLGFAVPVLIVALLLTIRGRVSGLLLWTAGLFYVLYVYVPYLLAVPFAPLFVVYLLLVSLSLSTLLGLLANISSDYVAERLAAAFPARLGGGILMGLALFVALVQGAEIGKGLTAQAPPPVQTISLWIADVVFAIPALAVSGILLWKKNTLGYVAGPAILIAYGLLSLGVVPLALIQASLKGKPADLSVIVVVTVMALICLLPFLLAARRATGKEEHRS